ncbi:MAG: hypothetical protein HON76_20455 [Candidatus Scalindua sp.]|jgi:hypothetical protein|nr:hypothetical protein [Candidatus Scalindua sp.]MBT5304079.1 hypothetical protein [Candidatus Scalindua sp.]MBT6225087.1 hypothetical protein [Candidatus Scalindua sp.]MBT6564893.1 hypothetical protein [Candidatus Scalindua sp.]MBT7212983.1 hypothetical protein [Candidatus Scalindua sp.]
MIYEYGGTGGEKFDYVYGIQSIALRAGANVDQITINGIAYGGDGGNDCGTLTLEAGEYINGIHGRSGANIDQVTFVTNRGKILVGGDGGGGDPFSIAPIKLKGIGGRSGSNIDRLKFDCE